MKQLLVLFIVLQLSLPSWGINITQEIENLLNTNGKKTSFSVRDSNGKELINIRGDLELLPASIAKTVSTGCSLRALGPAFQFETTYGFMGKISGDELLGDLVVRGQGDPSLLIEDLKESIEKLRVVYGIRKINGSLIFDSSYMAKESLPMSEGFDGDSGRSFAVEITPVSFNQNSFSLWTAASFRDDNKTIVSALPHEVVDVKMTNQTKMGKSTAVSVQYDPDKKRATLSGSLSPEGSPKGIWRAVPENYPYYSSMIHKLWLQSGGEWKSTDYKVSTAVVKFTELWKHQSRSLAKILMDVNKLSLNLGAELILLAAGAEQQGPPVSYPKAMQVIDQCLKDFAIPSGSIQMTNASGLSREARIKTSGLTMFLSAMSNSTYAPEYLSSLSILGTDGTAKTRLTGLAGLGRIKTGSIAGVSSIAGFLTTKKKQSLSFALIMNGVDQSQPQVKKTQDQIIEKVLLHDWD